MSDGTRYWAVTDIDYVESNKLVENSHNILQYFQRDTTKNGSRFFWLGDGGKAAYNYLAEHAPEKSLILNDRGEAVRLERATKELRTFPVRRPVKMGMTISDD